FQPFQPMVSQHDLEVYQVSSSCLYSPRGIIQCYLSSELASSAHGNLDTYVCYIFHRAVDKKYRESLIGVFLAQEIFILKTQMILAFAKIISSHIWQKWRCGNAIVHCYESQLSF
ncbi:MAG: hypothetical protein VW665_02870, partial [Candidatus Puniceispirillum sp.]